MPPIGFDQILADDDLMEDLNLFYKELDADRLVAIAHMLLELLKPKDKRDIVSFRGDIILDSEEPEYYADMQISFIGLDLDQDPSDTNQTWRILYDDDSQQYLFEEVNWDHSVDQYKLGSTRDQVDTGAPSHVPSITSIICEVFKKARSEYLARTGQAEELPVEPVEEFDSSDFLAWVESTVGVAVSDMMTCPISLDLMSDPVVTPAGHTYDRLFIEEAIESDSREPQTRAPLTQKQLSPVLSIKSLIESYKEQYKAQLAKTHAADADAVFNLIDAISPGTVGYKLFLESSFEEVMRTYILKECGATTLEVDLSALQQLVDTSLPKRTVTTDVGKDEYTKIVECIARISAEKGIPCEFKGEEVLVEAATKVSTIFPPPQPTKQSGNLGAGR